MSRNPISRLVLALAVVSGAAQAQIQHLTTDFAGDVLYFASTHVIRDTDQPHGKIFRWDRNDGVRVYLSRPRGSEPSPGMAVATNYFELDSPSVSRDGALLAFTAHRFCQSCLPLSRWGEQVVMRTADNTVVFRTTSRESTIGEGFLLRTHLSRNGRYMFSRVGFGDWGPVGIVPLDGSPAVALPLLGISVGDLPFIRAGTSTMVADNGLTIYLDRDFNLQTQGPGRTAPSTLVTIPRKVMLPMISASAEVIVYESQYANGVPRQLYAFDRTTNREALLFVDAGVDRFGPGLALYLFHSPYEPELPVPLFGASMDDGGWNILSLAREAADKPRQWLFLIHPDASEPRWIARVEEGYREAVISGNGRIIFAVTEAGRLLRVDTVTEQVEELLPRTPWIGEVSGSSLPGSEVRIRGGGLWGDPADITVEWQNQRIPVLSATDEEIRVLMPLDAPIFGRPFERNPFAINPLDIAAPPGPFLKVSVPSNSPLRLVPFSRNREYAERNGSGALWAATFRSPGPRHADGSVVTSANPASVGEVLSIGVSGVDTTGGVPLQCGGPGGQEMISALPSAGLPGVYEVRFRVTDPGSFFSCTIPSAGGSGDQVRFPRTVTE